MTAGARLGFIWLATLRDLEWRWRRFVVAVIAIALVFAITLLLSGFGESFAVEASRLTRHVGADGYVLRDGVTGPFTSPRPFPTTLAAEVAAIEGVREVVPLIALLQPDIYLLAYAGTLPGATAPIARQGFPVADTTFRGEVGEPLPIGIKEFAVGALSYGRTVFGGVPIVELALSDAQEAVFAGQPLVTALAVTGTPQTTPSGYTFVPRAQAEADFLRPIQPIRLTVRILSAMLWFVAAAIVGTLVYVSTLERLRDLAVFKATGAATSDLLGVLITQAVLISVLASLVAIGLAYLCAPLFPRPVYFPARVLLTLPSVGILVGFLASSAGIRRAVRVDPALAMGAPG